MSEDQGTRSEASAAASTFLRCIGKALPHPIILLFVVVMVWLLSGIFVVGPDEIGVVQTFGRKTRTEKPGLHYHLPYPISTALKPKIGRVNRLEFGFRTASSGAESPYVPMPAESMMLTGDENIVDLWFILQYRIENPDQFLFRLADSESSLRAAAEAAMRAEVGRTGIDEILTSGKQALTEAVTVNLQKTFDEYKVGVKIAALQLQAVQPPVQVLDAFKSVVSAREEMNQIVNEAETYANETLPLAAGEAETVLKEAEAFLEERRNRALGETARFLALLAECRKSREITRSRLYLEAMEEVMSRAGRIVLDPKDRNLLPFFMNAPEPQIPAPPGPEGD